jgi:hypothetical protein
LDALGTAAMHPGRTEAHSGGKKCVCVCEGGCGCECGRMLCAAISRSVRAWKASTPSEMPIHTSWDEDPPVGARGGGHSRTREQGSVKRACVAVKCDSAQIRVCVPDGTHLHAMCVCVCACVVCVQDGGHPTGGQQPRSTTCV